jgi:UMF1 family MFS transporter
MSNIFMSTSLIYLATEAAGCFDEEGKVDKANCETKIYGFLPASLITNIAIITGVLSALLMPLIGAVVDFTPYRRETGIASAVVLIVIQGVQIFTVPTTWFPMALLQAAAGFVYQIQVLATYAYLPELAAEVGEKTMTKLSSKLIMFQFSAQAGFLLLISVLAFVLKLTDVLTAQVSQAINCCWILVAFGIGWCKLLPKVGTNHERLPEGTSNLFSAGFAQLWRTAKSINTNYRRSLRWFYLALMFAEAGVNSFTVVAITFQTAHLEMNGAEIGIQFLVVLICTLPGAKIAELVTKKTDAKKSWIICLTTFAIITAVASFVLSGPEMKNVSYIFIVLWGVSLGWFYSTENLLFSMLLPKGQESEMSGIYVYCTQIIVWMPPLVFTIMFENGISMQWGLLSLVIFMGISVGLIACMAPWAIMLEEVSKPVSGVKDNYVSASEKSDDGVDPIEAAEP